jgi:hypothetical protein
LNFGSSLWGQTAQLTARTFSRVNANPVSASPAVKNLVSKAAFAGVGNSAQKHARSIFDAVSSLAKGADVLYSTGVNFLKTNKALNENHSHLAS